MKYLILFTALLFTGCVSVKNGGTANLSIWKSNSGDDNKNTATSETTGTIPIR